MKIKLSIKVKLNISDQLLAKEAIKRQEEDIKVQEEDIPIEETEEDTEERALGINMLAT